MLTPDKAAKPPRAGLRAGDVIADKYLIEREVASGGMGVIFAATHVVLRQRVAVKILRAESNGVPFALERFLREARAAAALESPHVCRVLDAATLESGAPYMVMEWLDGQDLATEMRSRTRIPLAEAVGYVIEACDAIAEAHFRGIVHRDLKPSNLFLALRASGARVTKVLDFGISKLSEGSVASAVELTHSATILGSPLYMSPEQVRSSKRVDSRTDIWSLGIILHELVAGAPPFAGDTLGSVIAQISADTPPPLRTLVPELPAAFERLVLRCLSRDPKGRPATAAALARELSPFSPGSSALVERMVSVATIEDEAPGTRTVALDRVGPRAQANSQIRSAEPSNAIRRYLLVALVLAIVFVALLWLRRPGSSPDQPLANVESTRPPPASTELTVSAEPSRAPEPIASALDQPLRPALRSQAPAALAAPRATKPETSASSASGSRSRAPAPLESHAAAKSKLEVLPPRQIVARPAPANEPTSRNPDIDAPALRSR